MMWSAFRASPTFMSFGSIVFMPTALPTTTDATTNASHPRMAVFLCLALQRPIRAAMFVLCFRGDMRFSSRVVDSFLAGSHRRSLPTVRRSGVFGWGKPHILTGGSGKALPLLPRSDSYRTRDPEVAARGHDSQDAG